MVICGDIAIPTLGFTLDIPEELRKKKWIVNLEGSMVEDCKVPFLLQQKKVFNNISAINELRKDINIECCSLANNHIEDCSKVKKTILQLKASGIKYVGAGTIVANAEQPILVDNGNTDINILSFGWDVIKCPIAKTKKSGVNPYNRIHVLETVKKNLQANKNLVCFFHWGYELEAYPLPYDRELAHTLIDMGVEAVVGCHAHRVQQIEFYKGKPIVYGLGNFFFPHGLFWDGRLRFPEFTRRELAFEISENKEYIAHWFDFDIEHNVLKYQKSEVLNPNLSTYEGRASYNDMSSEEYDSFFRVHRYHKKLLPVFFSHESDYMYAVKSDFVKIRGKIIDFLVKINLKAKK